ncbi:unnamed protein product [Choristocarpus tenellus]
MWIRLNKFMSCGDGQIRPVSEYRHKVVIIGDGFAEGLGDWVVLGGIAGLVRFLQRKVVEDDSIRSSWEIVNRGRSGSTSVDWLPDDTNKAFLSRNALSKACVDAEIFVVVVGTMDVVMDVAGMPITAMRKTALDDFKEDELSETCKNIREVCETLRNLGKRVAVCNVMTSGAGVGKRAGTAKRINRQLILYARSTEKGGNNVAGGKGGEGAGGAGGETTMVRHPVKLIKLNNPRASRDDGRAFDGLHLNSNGYQSFATEVYEIVRPMMIAVEWKGWKAKLIHTSNTSSREEAAQIEGPGCQEKRSVSKKTD